MRTVVRTHPSSGRTLLPAALLFSVAGVLFLLLAVTAAGHTPLPGDRVVMHAVQSLDLPALAICMRLLTQMGTGIPAVLITVGVALGLYRTASARDAAFMIATLPARLPNSLVKAIVERPRPSADMVTVLLPANGFSFPSGHAAGAMIFFGFLAWLVWLRTAQPLLRAVLLAGCGTFILLIGISRVYVGAHWPSDVFGGYAFGALVLAVLIAIHGWLETRSAPVLGPKSRTH